MVEISTVRVSVEKCVEPLQEPTLFEFLEIEEEYEITETIQEGDEEETEVEIILDHIELIISEYINDKGLLEMNRNIFSLTNRGIEDPQEQDNLIPDTADLPEYYRTAASILSQGDNREMENFLMNVNRNVVVNVNMSFYFKIMILLLTVNTTLLFKWIIWDQISQFFC
ncbi:unnamed protein product [Phyllotreta striolata]|uniref:Uncharacterized protein n=1 Tax=Phyllotreta striolata TaxID=444603 RepID=A0A9P0DJZ7_PHYSR|nr:unnamed protein product [Phyllotreta striolata]